MADLRGPEIEDFCMLKPIGRGAFGYSVFSVFLRWFLMFLARVWYPITEKNCQLSFHLCRKVFLGYKKQAPDHIYAIKMLNKLDIVHRNMASQGSSQIADFHLLF